jgi:hypothetical protein
MLPVGLRIAGVHDPYTATVSESSTVWCPSCGAEYRAGIEYCADCRVALTSERPLVTRASEPGSDDDLVELGEWPRLAAQILRARLETAGISVMAEWSSPAPDAVGVLLVPAAQADFAEAVINELEVDDEVPDTSPFAYVVRIEEHLAASAELLQELRLRLDALEADGKL